MTDAESTKLLTIQSDVQIGFIGDLLSLQTVKVVPTISTLGPRQTVRHGGKEEVDDIRHEYAVVDGDDGSHHRHGNSDP